MSNIISKKNVDKNIISKIYQINFNFLIKTKNENILYFFKLPNSTAITIYKNNSVLFQGEDASEESSKYFDNELINVIKSKQIIKPCQNIIGNDEVGVGDFFGPLVVASCYVDDNFISDNPLLINQIKDSKMLNDRLISEIFSQIKDKLIYEIFVIDNKLYNELYSKYHNSHTIKAIGHNKVLCDILEKNDSLNSKQIIIDQFVNENKYFSYLDGNKQIIKSNVCFETKAENKYISVALASIIARNCFIEKVKQLEEKYNISLPLGANNNVKLLVQKYKKEFGEESKYFIKLHFNDKIKNS